MVPRNYCEATLWRIARTVATATCARPAITAYEALEQIAEQLDLAGFGAADDETPIVAGEESLQQALF